MSGWHAGRVIENRAWTGALFSLRVETPALAFEAGQFVKIALDIDGARVARPFSFVNPPAEPVQEFYGVTVPEGLLSPRLARLAPGDTLWLSTNPSGFLVLSEVPVAPVLWLIATGTGIAPYLSILRTPAPWQRHETVVLVHAVRHAPELSYRETLDALHAQHGTRFRSVAMVSREAAPLALAGRIPTALADGRLEAAAGCALEAGSAQVMLCGNPDMVRDTIALLKTRGLRKHRRRSPGQITAEDFW